MECEGDCPNLTEWQRVLLRFYDLIGWENASGTRLGWNDLDSLEVGNGSIDGITDTEQQTAMTLWAMANAPMYLGGDLTKLKRGPSTTVAAQDGKFVPPVAKAADPKSNNN